MVGYALAAFDNTVLKVEHHQMRRKKIFISSVQKEFAEERQMLYAYINNDPLLGIYFEPFLFENLPAFDQQTNIAYIGEVAKSDIYLGLFGIEYGYEDEMGVSPTEREFDEATKKNKVRLIYVKTDAKSKCKPKMNNLIKKASLETVRKRFNSSSELLPNVYASLVNYLKENEFIRSVPFDTATVNAKIKDLDEIKIADFVELARAKRNFPLPLKSKPEMVLTHLNLLADGKLTNASILLFGKLPQRFFISSFCSFKSKCNCRNKSNK